MRYLSKLQEFFIMLLGLSHFRRNDEFRNILIDQYNDAESYLQIHKKCLACHSIQTELNISSSINFQLGSTLKDVKKKLSITKIDIIHNYSLNSKILYFKIIQNNYKTKCQLHFFENRLFLCAYTYSYMGKDERIEMIKKIQAKYISVPTNYLRQNIIDEFNNYILFNDTVDLTIYYLSLNSDFFNSIQKTSLLQN